MKRLAILLLALPMSANALIIEFSFVDDPADDNLGNIHVAGTVTGRILGLIENGIGQSATSVFIDSHPDLQAGFGSLDVLGIDLITGNVFANSFDVVGGIVTNAYFISNFFPNNGGTAQLRLNSQDAQEPGANVLRHQNFTGSGQQATGNRDGMAGINFSPVSIPEPGTLALFAIGLAGIGLARRRRTQ